MAIKFGSNLIHGSINKGIVDSEQVFGSFKTHIQSFADVRNFVDDYVNNGTNYFGSDLWGKYKPYATLVYVANGNPVNVLNDVSGLDLNVDYFVAQDQDGNDINIQVVVGSDPKVLLYTGNSDYATANAYDTAATSRFQVSGDGLTAVPLAWTDFSEYVGGEGSGISDVAISAASLTDVVNTSGGAATAFNQIQLGAVSGNATDGYSIEFPTNQAIRDAFSNPDAAAAPSGAQISVVDDGDGKMSLRVDENAVLSVAGVTTGALAATGNALIGGTLGVTGAFTASDSANFAGAVSFSADTIAGDNDGNVLLISSAGAVSSDTPSNVFSTLYPSVTQTVAGTANEIFVDGDVGAESGNVVLSLADAITLSPNNGGVTLGSANNSGQILTAYGNATINGNLTVTGDFVQTTSQTVTFTDNLLSLNITRDVDGNIPDDVAIGGLGTDAGIETFHGASTVTPTAGGADIHHVDNGRHSRPYIKYQYGTGIGIDNNNGLNWGKWKLANYYINPDVATDDTDAKQFEGSDWTVVEGTILTDLDASVTSLADLHTGTADTLTHLVTPNKLLSLHTVDESGDSVYTTNSPSGQEYSRKFGRVATNEVTYGSGTGLAPTTAAFEITHGLDTNNVVVMAIVTQKGPASNLPEVGSVITPSHQQGSSANVVQVKIQGVVASDKVKFVCIG